jgi:feruloyl esterase
MNHLICQVFLAGTATFCMAFATQASAQGMPCEELARPGLLPDTRVSEAVRMSAADGIPAHCRIVAVISPTSGSKIGVEYRLPDDWNGKFLGLGGGGLGGVIDPKDFTEGLKRGYAAAQTNIGHDESEKEWPLISPGVPNEDAIRDYAWRSVHLMTTVGKQLIQTYEGKAPDRSYWLGCSTGGRQGLLQAQRYPDSYDGIVAGAPVYTTALQAKSLWRDNALHGAGGTPIPQAKLELVQKAVLAACERRDGVKGDGFLQDPQSCDWDPGILQCQAGSASDSCLTEGEVKSMRMMYEGPKLADGTQLYPGQPRGGETVWGGSISKYNVNGIGQTMFKLMVKFDPNIDPTQFNLDRDIAEWNKAIVSAEGNATNPDIGTFVGRGGKLLLYHGLNDPSTSALATVDYYEKMEKVLAGRSDLMGGAGDRAAKVRESARLFLVPGMNHCRGGVGPNQFDALSALENWVEKGTAPEKMVATNEQRRMSRPLCPYPQVARYSGNGSTSDAANFSCVAK